MNASERDASPPPPQLNDQRSVLTLLKMLHGRVRNEKRSSFKKIVSVYERLLSHDSSRKDSGRIGEHIRMSNIGLVLDSGGMFAAEPVPLQQERMLSQNQFDLFQNISSSHANLWVPQASSSDLNAGHGGDFSLPFGSNQFMGLAVDGAKSPHLPDIFSGFPSNWSLNQSQIAHQDGYKNPPSSHDQRNRGTEVFFFGGTEEVRCTEEYADLDWGDDASSQTASLSEDSMADDHFSSSKPALLYAWEDIGDTANGPSRLAEETAVSFLRASPAIRIDSGTLEVHELDVIEDALRALSGVESTIFRRDIQSVTFKLPEMRALKLRNGTVKSLTSVLEIFRKAGSLFLRLEFLAIYYAQDSKRGGKTLQAMGDALLLYLSAHQSVVEKILHECGNCGSIASVVVKTRHLCRQLRFVAGIFRCDREEFWPLLLGTGAIIVVIKHLCAVSTRTHSIRAACTVEFPRGLALLNHLHGELTKITPEDALGKQSDVLTWFLIRASSPFLDVLSEFASLGNVTNATDPYDEFDLTKWSLYLTELSVSDGGDGLLARDFGALSVKGMVPDFLHKVADQVIRLGVVQRILQQSGSGSRTFASVLDEPLRLHRRIDGSAEMLSRLEERISVALLTNENAKRVARLKDLWALEDLRQKARDGLKLPVKNVVREKDEAYAMNHDFDVEMDEVDVQSEVASHATGDKPEQVSASLSDTSIDDLNPGADEIKIQLFDTLPDIHEYFARGGSSEDVKILSQALTNVRDNLDVRTPLIYLLIGDWCVRSCVWQNANESQEIQPFPLIVRGCIEAPIKLIGDTIDRLGVELFIEDLQVMEHLKWLHNIMLMSEGLCIDIFSRDLLAGLRSATKVSWGLSDRLTSALTLAMVESRIQSDQYAHRFYYATSEDILQALGSMTMTPDPPSLLAHIELQYKVDWPLGAVISSSLLKSYASVHRLLLYYRLTTLELNETWMITRKSTRVTAAAQALLKTCDNVFYKTQSFISAFNEAIVTKVLLTAWSELEHHAHSSNNLMQLREVHQRYVATAMSCCFLDAAGEKIYNAITRVFSIAWKLSSLVRTYESRLGMITGEATWARDLWRDHDAALRELISMLQQSRSNHGRSMREFLMHLHIRLNFNEFFPEQQEFS